VKYVTVFTIIITIMNIIIIIIIIFMILLSFRLSQTLWFLTKIPVLLSLDNCFLPSMLLIQPNLFHSLTIYISIYIYIYIHTHTHIHIHIYVYIYVCIYIYIYIYIYCKINFILNSLCCLLSHKFFQWNPPHKFLKFYSFL
jgi:hypothetical protein